MTINDLTNKDNFFLLAGPCVIEGEEMALRIAERVVKITDKLGIPYVFKGIVPQGQPLAHRLVHRHWRREGAEGAAEGARHVLACPW